MLKQKLAGLKWLYGVPLILLFDQASKALVLHYIQFAESVPVIPGLNFTLLYNRGIAFSMLKSQAQWGQIGLIAFIIAICLWIGYSLIQTPLKQKWSGLMFLFIFAGALGNLIDRFVYGHVIDFIDVYLGQWHFYVFNIADSFITIGAIMMLKELFVKDNTAKVFV